MSSDEFSQEISELLDSLSRCVPNVLEVLDFFDVQLSGHLTDGMGQFKNLVWLSLLYDTISGPIPWSIGNLSSLISLNLGNNQINGTLPQTNG